MNKFAKLVWVSLFFFTLFAGGDSCQIPLDVEKSIKMDFKTPTGLCFDGSYLWVADLQTSKIGKINLENGKIVKIYDAPCFNVSSLAFDGKNLWVLDAKEKIVYSFDPERNLTWKTLPLDINNPSGIGFDGKDVWISDSSEGVIVKIDTDDGTTLKSLTSPVANKGRSQITALTFNGGYLWASERIADEIYQIDIENNFTINILKAPGPYVSGISFYKNYLLCLDYEKRVIDFVKLPEEGKAVRYNPRKEKLSYGESYQNFGPGNIEELKIALAVPQKLIFQDLNSEIQFEPKNYTIEKDEWGQEAAIFTFKDIKPLEKVSAGYEVDCTLYNVSFFVDPKKAGSLSDIPTSLSQYLKDDTKLDIKNEVIVNAVKEAVKDEKNVYYIARRIYKYVQEKMHYEMVGGWNTAPVVLSRGSGSCSEYSFVMISMLRAAGVPARYAGSVVIRGDDASRDDVFHRWVEVYIPPFGWLPVDPSGGDSPSPVDQAKCFGSLENRFLITTIGGGGSKFLKWNYNSDSSYIAKGAVKIATLKAGDWAPLSNVQNEPQLMEENKSKTCAQ